MIKIAGLALLLLLTRVDPALSAPLRISYAAIAANIAGIWMAEGSGALKKYGLDVQFVLHSVEWNQCAGFARRQH